MLLTIPATNDRIVIRKIEIDAILKKSGVDYLFVTSLPALQAHRKSTYTYQIEVKSKSDKVEYALENGPKGMTISRTGRLTWEVPADFPDPEVPVIVSIRTASGQQVLHSFIIKSQ